MDASPTTGALAASLARAQARMTAAEKTAQNPHLRNRYADLTAYLAACRPALAAEEIALVQGVSIDGDLATVETRLMHSSGEWISSVLSLLITQGKGVTAAQSAGSTITYARRYALAALVGLSADDDDGSGGRWAQHAPQGEDEPPAAPPPVAATPRAKRASPTWDEWMSQPHDPATDVKSSAWRGYVARLGEDSWDYESVCRLHYWLGIPRPSALDPARRARAASWLQPHGRGWEQRLDADYPAGQLPVEAWGAGRELLDDVLSREGT